MILWISISYYRPTRGKLSKYPLTIFPTYSFGFWSESEKSILWGWQTPSVWLMLKYLQLLHASAFCHPVFVLKVGFFFFKSIKMWVILRPTKDLGDIFPLVRLVSSSLCLSWLVPLTKVLYSPGLYCSLNWNKPSVVPENMEVVFPLRFWEDIMYYAPFSQHWEELTM